MIEWMQKHRKYLVITIWISTIAFVGAGFVGWGAYSFTKNSSSMAKVGDTYISVKEFNFAYSNAYNNYNEALNGTLTKEKAEEMKLDLIVLSNMINETLMINYAKEIGIKTLDKDIKNLLANDINFQVDGKFNIDQYNRVLRNMGTTGTTYQEYLKRAITLQKLYEILNIPAKKELIDLLASTDFMEDKIAIETVSVNPYDINVNDKDLKAFWEPIKNDFKTTKSYDVFSEFIPTEDINTTQKELKEFYEESKFNYTDDDGKIKPFDQAKDEALEAYRLKKAKKVALLRYSSIKNKGAILTKKENIKETSNIYPVDKLTIANPNDVLKPFEYDNGYMILKLIKTNMPKPLSFENAKDKVLVLYREKKAQEILIKSAEEKLKTFNGTDVGFVSKDINRTIGGLTLQETRQFANKLFDNNNKKSFITLGNKAIVYNILEQNLLNNKKAKAYNKQLTQLATNLQNNQLQTNLLNELRKRYKIEQYYKGN